MVKEELYLHDPWADEQGECSHKYMYVQLGARNIKKNSIFRRNRLQQLLKMTFEKSSTGLKKLQ